MKKIIAISVMFVLLTGAVFAVDLGGTVIGTAYVLQGDTGKDSNGDSIPITSGGNMDRVRIHGAGEAGDGAFGGYIRYQGDPVAVDSANAWWKPIDQLKIIIGNNSDGIWGKEGVTGWMFTQGVTDTGVIDDGGNVWGGHSRYDKGPVFRNAFFGGVGDKILGFEITPAEIASINIGLPVFDGGKAIADKGSNETAVVFQSAWAQLDLNLDFGNIAITYVGKPNYYAFQPNWNAGAGSVIYAYFGIKAIENLGIDVGLGYQMTGEDKVKQPIAAGLGLKYAADSFGIKFRAVASLAGDDKETNIIADVLPYFILSDSMRAFVSVGLGMFMPEEGDSVTAWHFNPWLEIGAEWGPTFYIGIKAQSNGKDAAGDSTIQWSVPLAIAVSF